MCFMTTYVKESSYGRGNGESYSNSGIDLRSTPYFEGLRRFETMYEGRRSLYNINIKKNYELNSY